MSNLTFQEAAPQYLQNLALENGKNLTRKRCHLRLERIPFFTDMELSAIKRVDIERFKRQMLEKGYAPATVNRYLALLSQLLRKAVELGWLEKVPCQIQKYREDNIRTLYLSSDEITQLIQAAYADRSPIIEPFIRIALGTAMRQLEILSMKIEHIDCRQPGNLHSQSQMRRPGATHDRESSPVSQLLFKRKNHARSCIFVSFRHIS